MNTKKKSRKKRNVNNVRYPIPSLTDTVKAMRGISQIPKDCNSNPLVRNSWKYSSSKRTLKC